MFLGEAARVIGEGARNRGSGLSSFQSVSAVHIIEEPCLICRPGVRMGGGLSFGFGELIFINRSLLPNYFS